MNLTYDENGVYIRNLANTADKLGVGQYCFALNYELVGSEFAVADKSGTHKLTFVDRETVIFNDAEYAYECLKLEKNTYFVRFGLNVLVLDIEQRLATLILDSGTVSGVILSSGHQSPETGHADAGGDMVGTRVRWILGCGRYVDHDYFAEHKVRAAWSAKSEQTEVLPCKAVKIKGPIYLVDIAGSIPKDVCAPSSLNRVIMLQDYDHMMLVGCIMGTGVTPVMISGYAGFLD